MTDKRHSLGSKLGYATGDILGGGAFTLITILYMAFLISFEGISPALAGLVVMVGKIWDAISDPLMGMISDRTKCKYGRRRLYFLIGIVPVILSFALMWHSFGITGELQKTIYYACMYILFSTAFTIVMVPYNALLPDMVDGYTDRCSYSTIRMFISNLSSLICATVPSLILGQEGTRTQASYLKMSVIFGLFFGLPLIVTFLTTWEKQVVTEEESQSFSAILNQFKTSFKNRAYRQYLGIFIFGQFTTDVISTVMAFWLVDVLKRIGWLTPMSGIALVVGVLMLPLFNHISKKRGKHLSNVIFQPLRIIALAVAIFMGSDSPSVVLIVVALLIGVGSGASSFVPWTLLPDIPDSDEMITGHQSAGIYAGMSTFVRKFTSGLGIFLVGLLLQSFGYVKNDTSALIEQTPRAIFGIRFIIGVIPILLSLITIFISYKYTLTIKNHRLIREAIDYRRKTGLSCQDAEVIGACETVSGLPFAKLWVGGAEGPEA